MDHQQVARRGWSKERKTDDEAETNASHGPDEVHVLALVNCQDPARRRDHLHVQHMVSREPVVRQQYDMHGATISADDHMVDGSRSLVGLEHLCASQGRHGGAGDGGVASTAMGGE